MKALSGVHIFGFSLRSVEHIRSNPGKTKTAREKKQTEKYTACCVGIQGVLTLPC